MTVLLEVGIPLAVVFIFGVALALTLTPIARRACQRLRLVDHPDDERKFHSEATPLGGGLVLLGAMCLSVSLIFVFPGTLRAALQQEWAYMLALLAGSTLIVGLGLVDDRFHLRGRHKLLGQLVVAGVVVAFGIQARRLQVLDQNLELGVLAIPFTVFWILGAINALNLLDGSDGVAATTGIVLSAAICVMATMLPGREVELAVAVALLGTLTGFLFFNFPPATIFLGDSGSMLIGLVIGVMTLRSGLKAPATIALAAPIAIFAIPIMDTTMAIVRRALTGRSVYTPDNGHIHHCLRRKGFSSRHTVACVGVLCAATSLAALVSVYQRNELLAYVGIGCVCVILAASRLFGYAETGILIRRLRLVIESASSQFRGYRASTARSHIVVGRGTRWEAFWNALCELSARHRVGYVWLNIHHPTLGEEFHAIRRCPAHAANADRAWQLDMPLHTGTGILGRLRMRGVASQDSHRIIAEASRLLANYQTILSVQPDRHSSVQEPVPLESREQKVATQPTLVSRQIPEQFVP